MKRHITLATLAVLSLASVPAFAQVRVRDHRSPDVYRRQGPILTNDSPVSGPAGRTVTVHRDVRIARYDRGNDYGNAGGYGKGKSWSRSSIRNKYNRAFLRLPAVRSELSLHADRTARLNRMLRLSIGRPGMSQRIHVALNREDRRHDNKMASLKAEWGRVRYLGSSR